MRMTCFTYGRDYTGGYYAIFKTYDGRLCRVEFSAWNGNYSGFTGNISITEGFTCDSNDFDYITKWFNNENEFYDYCMRNGYSWRN